MKDVLAPLGQNTGDFLSWYRICKPNRAFNSAVTVLMSYTLV